jgi:hypothetical protein
MPVRVRNVPVSVRRREATGRGAVFWNAAGREREGGFAAVRSGAA